MLHSLASKTVIITPPAAAVNGASAVCAAVDRKGFDYTSIRVILGVSDAALTALKLQESDDNSTWTDISGFDYSISPNTLPAAGAAGRVYAFDTDLRPRKRYLRPVITVASGTTGAFLTVLADLHRAEQAPRDATTRGLTAALVG